MLHCMARTAEPADLDTARRLKILRTYAKCVGVGGQTQFAARYGFELKTWNNYERGYSLPSPAAIQLVQKFPGLTLDWIHLGKTEGLPGILRTELEEAEKALTSAEDGKARRR